MSRKERDLENLSCAGFPLLLDDDLEFVIVQGVMLPPGYNRQSIPVLIELPENYPLTPPGIGGNFIYVPGNIRYRGCELQDLHPETGPSFRTPGFSGWAWLCYEKLEFSPFCDDLITLIETIRTDLTNPRTYRSY